MFCFFRKHLDAFGVEYNQVDLAYQIEQINRQFGGLLKSYYRMIVLVFDSYLFYDKPRPYSGKGKQKIATIGGSNSSFESESHEQGSGGSQQANSTPIVQQPGKCIERATEQLCQWNHYVDFKYAVARGYLTLSYTYQLHLFV